MIISKACGKMIHEKKPEAKNLVTLSLSSKTSAHTRMHWCHCAAHIGMGGVKIKKEPCQRDEYVYRIS